MVESIATVEDNHDGPVPTLLKLATHNHTVLPTADDSARETIVQSQIDHDNNIVTLQSGNMWHS